MKYIECLNKGNDTEIHILTALETSINLDNSKLANQVSKLFNESQKTKVSSPFFWR